MGRVYITTYLQFGLIGEGGRGPHREWHFDGAAAQPMKPPAKEFAVDAVHGQHPGVGKGISLRLPKVKRQYVKQAVN